MMVNAKDTNSRHCEMRTEDARSNNFDGPSRWAMPSFSLHIAMAICVILSLLNLRGGSIIFPEASREISNAYNDYPDGIPTSTSYKSKAIYNSQHYQKSQIDDGFLQLQPTKNETIIIGLANKDYASVAILWYRRMTAAGFTNHRILAADKPTAWICEELDFRYDDLSKYTRPIVPACSPGYFDKDQWNRKTYLFVARWIYVRQKLLEGYHVLMTDVDAVYNYNEPVSKLEEGDFDHYTAYANKMPAHIFQQLGFTICGCFNWMRSTPSMIHFLNLFLSNCGCTSQPTPRQGSNNATCTCACDDQVTMNSMFFYQLDMVWDPYRGSKKGEFLQNSLTGTSQRTGQRIKILDRNFVFRGHDDNICTQGNWITFPKTSNETETKVEQMNRLLGNCPLQVATRKLASNHTTTTSVVLSL
jgi:Nucleotide-diphospho-sugar transferase